MLALMYVQGITVATPEIILVVVETLYYFEALLILEANTNYTN